MSGTVPTGTIHYQCCGNTDQDTLRRVTAEVLRHYDGCGETWQIPAESALWPISLGGRAGVVGVRLQDRVCCVKLFYDHRWMTRIRTWAGQAKAKSAYRHALRLQQVGVGCPSPLGYAEVRPWGPALLVTELIDDGMRLDHWIEAHGVSREGVNALACFLSHMHDRGVTHQDLSPRNILIRPSGTALEWLLLDYEDTRFADRVSEAARLDDLHHLHERVLMSVSLKDCLRCLRGYAGPDYEHYREKLNRRILNSRSKYVLEYRRSGKPGT